MAIIKKSDFKAMSPEDLQKKMKDLQKDLVKFNAQVSTGTTPKSPGLIRETKKTIAKIITNLKERGNARHE